MQYPPGTEVRYTPDLPPQESPLDLVWWFMNRNAELGMRIAPEWGLHVARMLQRRW